MRRIASTSRADTPPATTLAVAAPGAILAAFLPTATSRGVR